MSLVSRHCWYCRRPVDRRRDPDSYENAADAGREDGYCCAQQQKNAAKGQPYRCRESVSLVELLSLATDRREAGRCQDEATVIAQSHSRYLARLHG